MRQNVRAICAAIFILGTATVGHAIPKLINYQGILTDNGGTPIVVATNATFSIYDAAGGGNLLWSETQSVMPDANGLFNVLLGSVSSIPDSAFDGNAYLGVTAAGDPEMTPRTRIVSVGYAYRTNSIDGALGGDVNGDVNILGQATIGFAHNNAANGGFIAGTENFTSGSQSSVGGGNFNGAFGSQAVTAGGYLNSANGDWTTVSGGYSNLATGTGSTISGGRYNKARGSYAVIGGGGGSNPVDSNLARGFQSVVSGGLQNEAYGDQSVVGGGEDNTATGQLAVVCGGGVNLAYGGGSVVSGGTFNETTGLYSMVPGGTDCRAFGSYSFAAGRSAKAEHSGAFVWGDSYNGDVSSSALNQFTARTSGGARFFSNTALTTGVSLAPGGGAWASISDRNLKENVRPIDGEELLKRLAELSISRWNYKSQDASVEHIGPMAQDFYRLFNVGDDDKTICTIDPDGIALAAIQELLKRNEALESELLELKQRVEKLDSDHQ